MPNYKYVANSTFKPFTYDELYAPIKAREEAHDKAELAAMTLQEQVADLQGVDLGSDERNAMLNNFKRSLDYVYNQLGESGITPDLSRRLQGLKRDYARDILPIIKKVDALNLAEETRSKLTSENPNIMFKHSLPTVGQAIDGAKIDQGYWDTGKITLSIEEQVIPLISDLLSREKILGDKENYRSNIEHIKNTLRSNNTDFMPEGFNVDSIVNNLFNTLYDKELLSRAQRENALYNLDPSNRNNNRGTRGNSGGGGTRRTTEDTSFLNPRDASGNLKREWKEDAGTLTITDDVLRNKVESYVLDNFNDDARVISPIIETEHGYKFKNTRDFTFDGDTPTPKNYDAYVTALRKKYRPTTLSVLVFPQGAETLNDIKPMSSYDLGTGDTYTPKAGDLGSPLSATTIFRNPALKAWQDRHPEGFIYAVERGGKTMYIAKYNTEI